jgi:hypothetical protein
VNTTGQRAEHADAKAFAANLPPETAALMAATQRPIAATAFSDVCGPPAWRKLPSWAVVATGDKATGSDLVRSMAQRAGADIVEVEASRDHDCRMRLRRHSPKPSSTSPTSVRRENA